MRGNIAQLMQQAQKMQENLQRAQEELAQLEVTGGAGGGMVSVTLSGTKECRKVRIDPSLLAEPDAEMIEDLVAAAFNDASNKIDAESQDKMGAATAGMPMPPGMQGPRGAMPQSPRGISLGTGFLISADGYVLTCRATAHSARHAFPRPAAPRAASG
mgnify:CR=1 FL=1